MGGGFAFKGADAEEVAEAEEEEVAMGLMMLVLLVLMSVFVFVFVLMLLVVKDLNGCRLLKVVVDVFLDNVAGRSDVKRVRGRRVCREESNNDDDKDEDEDEDDRERIMKCKIGSPVRD